MSDDRLITAIGRIERALSRIEAKGGAPAVADAKSADDLRRLQLRHSELRARTQAAIERLDRLIGVNGGNGAISGD